jgi:hypothetical protein
MGAPHALECLQKHPRRERVDRCLHPSAGERDKLRRFPALDARGAGFSFAWRVFEEQQMRVTSRIALLVLLVAPRLRAATFIVPDDRSLVQYAKAIVVATPIESHARWTNRWIETVTTMRVEETIRGAFAEGDTFDDVELGGEYGDVAYVVPGSPQYTPGERVLLFLGNTDRGEWTAKAMAVGKFAFAGDGSGRDLLLRDARELFGWDNSGAVHREPRRDAAKFLDYVRGVARGENPPADYLVREAPRAQTLGTATTTANPTITSYLLLLGDRLGLRWQNPTATFLSHGSQPGALNGGLTALQRGLGTWTSNSTSSIHYGYGGTSTVGQGLNSPDGVNSAQFNDPAGEIPGAYTGQGGDVLAIGGAWAGGATHTFGGETFHTITEADLVVQNGITGPGLTGNGFDHVLAHELGHTLGFRHSDEPPAGGTSTSNALMNSSVNFNNDGTGAALQAWDREAAAAVYGSGASPQPQPQPQPNPNPTPSPVPIPTPGPPPPCDPPAILAQPQSQSLTGAAGVTLSVVAASTTQLNYQWYVGAPGVTSSPVSNGGVAEIVVKPSVTTSYWVRVINSCTAVDSIAAVVTVGNCPIVSLSGVTFSQSITRGTTLTLSATATGGNVSYTWFSGASGDTSHPISASPSVDVTPLSSSQYWVRATNDCGASIASDTVTITVEVCNQPVIVVPPAGGDFVVGDTVTLSAVVTGTGPLQYQWTQNGAPIFGANSSTITVGPLFGPATFGLKVSNTCGEATAPAVSYRIAPSCVAPAIVTPPVDQEVSLGGTALLTVNATGTSLAYRWYLGQMLDFTHPVGASTPALVTAPVTQPVQYWVLVQNSCGSAQSGTITLTPATGSRHRGVRH